jgi:hypothetical protein
MSIQDGMVAEQSMTRGQAKVEATVSGNSVKDRIKSQDNGARYKGNNTPVLFRKLPIKKKVTQ